MPELPEVETVRIGLARLLPGRVVHDVWHDWAKGFPNAPADVARFLVGAKITDVRRRAKVLLIDLSSDYTLVIHLKMTGQLVFAGKTGKRIRDVRSEIRAKPKSQISNLKSVEERFGGGHPTRSLVDNLPDKSTRVILHFDNDAKLFFNDQRKFGWMRLIPTIQVPKIDFFKKVGPEPLDDNFTVDRFIERIKQRPKGVIKAVLLDQTVLAGVGNIYADEALFAAKIHPVTRVAQISRTKLVALYSDLITILKVSIEKGGATDRSYVNAKGQKGTYLGFAQVFRKQGQPCPRCGTPIEKIRVAGRGTHICPRCQKTPKG